MIDSVAEIDSRIEMLRGLLAQAKRERKSMKARLHMTELHKKAEFRAARQAGREKMMADAAKRAAYAESRRQGALKSPNMFRLPPMNNSQRYHYRLLLQRHGRDKALAMMFPEMVRE